MKAVHWCITYYTYYVGKADGSMVGSSSMYIQHRGVRVSNDDDDDEDEDACFMWSDRLESL